VLSSSERWAEVSVVALASVGRPKNRLGIVESVRGVAPQA
jgi:hypothetical protein